MKAVNLPAATMTVSESVMQRISQANNFARGYGGPSIDPQRFADEYLRGEYLTYKQLYEDVQLELDNIASLLASKYSSSPTELVWFSDSIDPAQYASPTLTPEFVWKEDLKYGIDYFSDLLAWLNSFDPEPLTEEDVAYIDRSSMKSIHRLLWDFEWEHIDNNWDEWGPYAWEPSTEGEWSRCRDVVRGKQDFPVALLFDGSMLDGAHRLAVAVFSRNRWHPALIGVPSHFFEAGSSHRQIQAQLNLQIEHDVYGFHHGQMDAQFLARVNGRLVGVLQYAVLDDEAYIGIIQVLPEFRRQGIATALMKRLELEANENNWKIVHGMMTDDGVQFINAYGKNASWLLRALSVDRYQRFCYNTAKTGQDHGTTKRGDSG